MVSPGDDPARLQLNFPDARLVEVDRTGDLIVHGDQTEPPGRPQAYQRIAGARRDVDIRFVMGRDGNIGFALGAYDRTQPLTIEPRR